MAVTQHELDGADLEVTTGELESALPDSSLVIQMPHTAGAVTWGQALPGDPAVLADTVNR